MSVISTSSVAAASPAQAVVTAEARGSSAGFSNPLLDVSYFHLVFCHFHDAAFVNDHRIWFLLRLVYNACHNTVSLADETLAVTLKEHFLHS